MAVSLPFGQSLGFGWWCYFGVVLATGAWHRRRLAGEGGEVRFVEGPERRQADGPASMTLISRSTPSTGTCCCLPPGQVTVIDLTVA